MLRGKGSSLALAAVASMTLGGCYGSFNLTRQAHHWLGTFPDQKEWSDASKGWGPKWASEAVFFFVGGFIYGVTGFVDSLVLNSIEFWTGDNPMDPPATGETKTSSTRTLTSGDRKLVIDWTGDEKAGSARINLYERGVLKSTFVAEGREGEMTRLCDAGGNLIATATTLEDGEIAVFGVDGKCLVR